MDTQATFVNQEGAELPDRAASAAAFTSSSAAVVAGAACCVIPLALPSAVLAATGGALAWLTGAHQWMTGIAVLAVAAAWLLVWWQGRRSRLRPRRGTLGVMIASTGLLVIALAWPEIEPLLMRAMS